MTDERRRVPRTDRVLADPRLRAAADRLGPDLVKATVRDMLQQVRVGAAEPASVVDLALAALPVAASSLHRVINATGVIVHTNLGRAPLSTAAVEAVRHAAGCTDVELDLTTGRRGRRGAGAHAALAEAVPAAGAVLVVNNNAAALLLAATAFASGREIVVARGELVEIGDGFRIPDLLAATGARLREVGTTNRVHLADYAGAVGPDTAMVLKVHPSNFVVSGFTAQVPVTELAGLGVPVVHDIGSGLLVPHPLLPGEPDASTSLRDGAALVTASGDKLLGGPQCGLMFGDADLVDGLRRHPITRALRVDKLRLAALEASLRGPRTPVGSMLAADGAAVRLRADKVAERLAGHGLDADALDCSAAVGGGGAPGVSLPSAGVSVPATLAGPLRTGSTPVVGRVERGRCLLDLRTVAADEDDVLVAAVLAASNAAVATGTGT